MKYITITKLYTLFALLFLPLSVSYADSDTVPIPRMRPAVMSASQAYIDALMARESGSTSIIHDEQILPEALNHITPSASAGGDFIFDDGGSYPEIEDIDAQDLLFSLDGDMGYDYQNAISEIIVDEFVPVPVRKPVILASAANSSSMQFIGKKALISFTLKPEQIDLDSNLEQFLIDYAIGMFSSNQALKMEIYAYATPENEQEYSDVRRSLARALEVRRFLLSQNIQASRLKIIPVGLDSKNKADDRIDLVFTTSK